MRMLLFSALCTICYVGHGQSYPVSEIPDSLKKNAVAVQRLYECTIEVKSTSSATVHEKYAYTIFNHKGDKYADMESEEYSQLIKLNFASGRLIDAAGKELKHFKTKDMTDRPVNDQGSLMLDDRIKLYSYNWISYPYTVEFEQEYEMNGFLGFDSWVPQAAPQVAVQQSRFTVVAPKDYQIRYKGYHGAPPPVITEVKSTKLYLWTKNSLTAKEDEFLSPEWKYITPYVLIGPTEFEIQGYKGNMSTWQDYSKFFSELRQGRDVLPDNDKIAIHAVTDSVTDVKRKIARVYEYMQNRTHYISVQLGIGGWQPFDAKYVSKNGYGDCKALSNYMVALLKEVGIRGNSVCIRAGKNNTDFNPDFVSSQFNHVICCVPLKNDSIWLECTSQFLPAGYLSEFTANRFALFIDGNSGSLVRTPAYRLKDNVQKRVIESVLDADGNLSASVTTAYKAESQDLMERLLDENSKEERLDYLKTVIDLPTFEILSHQMDRNYTGPLPEIDERMKLSVSNYAQVTGRRLFINANLLGRSKVKYEPSADRKYDIFLKNEFQQMDSVTIAIPPGYTVEALPKAALLTTAFGKYSTNTVVSNEKIVYFRRFDQYSGTFAPSKYDELVKFYDEIYRSDRDMIVLVRGKQ